MNTTEAEVSSDVAKKHKTSINVVVHYVAAEKPFHDKNANHSETVGQLKQRVLTEFGLTEGQTPDGNITTYQLYHLKSLIENMGQTLGDLAGDDKALQLKLVQQIIQGRQ
jgi:lipopolysaccharide biosynthesis glycosyltransferase